MDLCRCSFSFSLDHIKHYCENAVHDCQMYFVDNGRRRHRGDSVGYRDEIQRWSVDYVMPLCCCAAMLAMVIAAQVKHLQIEDYLAYMLIDILFGAVSFILLLTGIVGSDDSVSYQLYCS